MELGKDAEHSPAFSSNASIAHILIGIKPTVKK